MNETEIVEDKGCYEICFKEWSFFQCFLCSFPIGSQVNAFQLFFLIIGGSLKGGPQRFCESRISKSPKIFRKKNFFSLIFIEIIAKNFGKIVGDPLKKQLRTAEVNKGKVQEYLMIGHKQCFQGHSSRYLFSRH